MEKDNAQSQAAAQYASIVELVHALQCDFDRLEELQDMEQGDMSDDEKEELQELTEQASGYDSEDAVREAINNDPLSVEVRSDWHSLGETLEASEFRILLCTGGPAAQIRGELDEHNEPCRAWIEYQDWGTTWTRFFDAEQETLLDYCRQFYFGE